MRKQVLLEWLVMIILSSIIAVAYRNCQAHDKAIKAYENASEAHYNNHSYPYIHSHACTCTCTVSIVIILINV